MNELNNLKCITKINTTYKTTYERPPPSPSLLLFLFYSFLDWKNEDSLAYFKMISYVHGLNMPVFVFNCMCTFQKKSFKTLTCKKKKKEEKKH